MLTKVAILFLLAMVGLALIGRLFRGKSSGLPLERPLDARRCKRCGDFVIGDGDCTCDKPSRIGRG